MISKRCWQNLSQNLLNRVCDYYALVFGNSTGLDRERAGPADGLPPGAEEPADLLALLVAGRAQRGLEDQVRGRQDSRDRDLGA